MSKDNIPPETPAADNPGSVPSAREQISALVDDVRVLARAEWDYAVGRMSYSGSIVKRAGLYAILAIFAAAAAAIALVLGILLIIASYWGPWVATGATLLGFMALALILGLRARNIASELNFVDGEADAD